MGLSELEEMPEELHRRYIAALHAMQSGVAAKLALGDSSECTPKHLRVGVNSAMVDTGVLTRLLIRKGVFTSEEFYEELVAGMEREQDLYEQKLGVKLA